MHVISSASVTIASSSRDLKMLSSVVNSFLPFAFESTFDVHPRTAQFFFVGWSCSISREKQMTNRLECVSL